MGVLACSRTGCPNIMCDRYPHKYGYICDSCFEELVQSRTSSIAEFMDTLPNPAADMSANYRKWYDEIFPIDD